MDITKDVQGIFRNFFWEIFESKLGFLQTLFEYEFKNSNVYPSCWLDSAVQVI